MVSCFLDISHNLLLLLGFLALLVDAGSYPDLKKTLFKSLYGFRLPRLQKWIAETMADDFQDDFIVDFTAADLADSVQRDDLVSQGLRYSLETDPTDEDVNIAVNLGPLVCGKRRGPAGQGTSAMSQAGGGGSSGLLANKMGGNKAARMIPHFR